MRTWGIIGGLSLWLLGCAPNHLDVRGPPKDAIARAAARLVERGIAVDPATRGGHRVRTAWFCYRAPGLEGRQWDRSFAATTGAPVPFSYESPIEKQGEAVKECPYIFRVEIAARASGSGSELVVESAWWRPRQQRCAHIGDPILGQMVCEYAYVGTVPPEDPARYVYGLLQDL